MDNLLNFIDFGIQYLKVHPYISIALVLIIILMFITKFGKHILKYMAIGFIIFLPIFLMFDIFQYITSDTKHVLNLFLSNEFNGLEQILIALIIYTLLGFLVSTKVFKWILTKLNKLFSPITNIPLIGYIYKLFNKFIFSPVSEKHIFEQAVIVKIGETEEIGFLTNLYFNEIDSKKVCVFIPSIPIPTSGRLIFIDKSNTQKISLDINEILEKLVAIQEDIDFNKIKI